MKHLRPAASIYFQDTVLEKSLLKRDLLLTYLIQLCHMYKNYTSRNIKKKYF